MHQDDTLIRVDSVSKRFCRNLRRSLMHGISDIGADLMGQNRSDARLRKGEFWANQDLSFALKRGECMGLIGHNGAGKTTLLKMLNGLIRPDRGRIEMRGQVGALIALGAGFNPVLTGRENVFIAGSVLGLSRSAILSRYDEIVEFAQLADFMETPVQSYSSGMQVRLGFAVATALDPDVLLVDEVLAVGDASFRARCANRIDQIRSRSAVILVSHNMEHIRRVSTSVFQMDRGQGTYYANPNEGVAVHNSKSSSKHEIRPVEVFEPLTQASIDLEDNCIAHGGDLTVNLEVESTDEMEVSWRIVIRDTSEAAVAESDSRLKDRRLVIKKGTGVYRIRVSRLELQSGAYDLSVVLLNAKGDTLMISHRRDLFKVAPGMIGVTPYIFNSEHC